MVRMQQAAARQVALGVSMRDYEKAVDGVCDGYGIRKSSVSRHWKAISTQKLEELMERPLGDLDLVAILIDGVNFEEHVVAVSVGVSSDGSKHVLGLWQGATENTQIVKELLADMVRRGLDTERRCTFSSSTARRHSTRPSRASSGRTPSFNAAKFTSKGTSSRTFPNDATSRSVRVSGLRGR